ERLEGRIGLAERSQCGAGRIDRPRLLSTSCYYFRWYPAGQECVLAEGQRRLTLAPDFGVTLEGLAKNRLVAFVLQWSGLVIAAALGLAASLYYIVSPETLRPLFDDSYISLNFARNLAEHGKLSFDG